MAKRRNKRSRRAKVFCASSRGKMQPMRANKGGVRVEFLRDLTDPMKYGNQTANS